MDILIASKKHIKYANIISETIESSAKARDTGIALRTPDYIIKKIKNKNAIICLDRDKFVGFCYCYILIFKALIHPENAHSWKTYII